MTRASTGNFYMLSVRSSLISNINNFMQFGQFATLTKLVSNVFQHNLCPNRKLQENKCLLE